MLGTEGDSVGAVSGHDDILDEIGPLLGHRSSSVLGFCALTQRYDGTFPTSANNNEFCYVNGQVVHWSSASCQRYSGGNNGNCTVSYFTLSR